MDFAFVFVGAACIWLVWWLIRYFEKMKAERNAWFANLETSGWSLDHVLDNSPGMVFDMKHSRFTFIHDEREKVYSFSDITSVDWEYLEKVTGPIVQREKNKIVLTLRDPERPLVKFDFAYDWRGAEKWRAKIPAILGW